jgi:2-polyprenyl-6-methoxyphenol hydroxylase-like FAD-dependent oxidoreductase
VIKTVAATERDHPVAGDQAVVIGAGVAGLFVARVLSEFFDQVIVVDQDALPDHSANRAGVPQGHHLHVVLTRGTFAIRELFPGLIDDLIAEGAPSGDLLEHSRTYFDGYRLARATSGLPALGVTRPYLEYRIRERVERLGNVTFVASRRAVGPIASPDGRAIVGVLVEGDGEDGGGELTADLVVDASGRNSQTPRWLEDLGYRPPDEDRIAIDLAYTSCAVSLPADALDGDLGVAVGATVSTPRGGALSRIEGDRWLVSLAGYRGHHPPVSPDRFQAFAETLVVPDLAVALRRAAPLTRPVRYRIPHVVRRHYHRLAPFPAGLVVVGDAVSFFNPLYGQGMSVAAVESLILRQCLRQGPRSLTHVRHKIANAASVAWTMSVSSDLRMPWIEGPRTALVRFGNRYLAYLYRAAQHDPVVAREFLRVANLVASPTRIVRPDVVARVVAGAMRRRPVNSLVGGASHNPPRSTPPGSPDIAGWEAESA